MNINVRPKKCSGFGHYVRYSSYAIDKLGTLQAVLEQSILNVCAIAT